MPRKYINPKLEKRTDVKRPYWFIRVTVPGPEGKRKRIPQRLAWCDEAKREEALRLRARALEIANSGKLLAQSQVKFSQVVVQYRAARLPQFGAGTQKWQASLIERHILPAFGQKRLSEIDKPMIEAWLAAKEKLSWWSRKALRSVLASIFAAARDWGIAKEKPTEGVRIGRKREAREKRLLTAEQLRAILAGVCDDTRLMILTAVLLGLRISEVCGLQWGDVDFQGGTLEVRRRYYRGDVDEPKTDASRRRHELGPLLGEFQLRRGGTAASGSHGTNSEGGTGDDLRRRYVFAGVDGLPPDERDVLRYEVRPLLKRLGIYTPGMGWHALRRTNLTLRQTVGGATPLEAMKAAGHSRVDTTLLYTLTDAERERGQVQAIFDSIVGTASVAKQ